MSTPALISPGPKRDRFGRYLLPDPDTGIEQAWTRATTFAKSISDTFGLARWQQRMVAKGVGLREDLYALAAATPAEDKTTLDRLCEQAISAAQQVSKSNLGTALHSFTETVDRGLKATIPPAWAPDIAAYQRALAEAGIRVRGEYIEQIVLVKPLGLAGTFDRILQLADGRLVIADVKTGADLSWAWNEIAVQLALYARASHLWDPWTNTWAPMPAVDQDVALVIHLPVGKGEATLHTVDVAAGWQAAELCASVRAWRARKDLHTPGVPAPAVGPDRLAEAIKGATTHEGLYALWHAGQASRTWRTEHTTAAAARKAQLSKEESNGKKR